MIAIAVLAAVAMITAAIVAAERRENQMKRYLLCMTAEQFGRSVLNIGRVNENNAVRVKIDLSRATADDPQATAGLTLVTPSGETYPAAVTMTDGVLVWDVSASDVAEAGNGKAQLTIFGASGEVLKSAVAITRIGPGIETGVTTPDPIKNWADSAAKQLGEVVNAGKAAEVAARKANTAADTAEEAAQKAEEAAKKAEDAAASGGGTQSDYAQNDATQPDYIKNRPGGYYQTVSGVNITWDGVIGDRPKVEINEGVYLVKVSDEVLTAEQVIGTKMTFISDEGTEAYTLASSDIYAGDVYVIAEPYNEIAAVSTSTQNVVLNGTTFTFPETGTYFETILGDYTLYISSLQNAEHQALVPIPGELTNIKGGYDLPAISTQPLYSGTVPASAFSVATQAAQGGEIAVQAAVATNYGAPVTLTNPLAEGATVSGTVNGTAVSGVVEANNSGGLCVWLYTTGASEQVAVQGADEGVLVCALTKNAVIVRNNPPETDMALELTQSRGATPKVIPAEYLNVDLSAVESRIDEVEAAVSNAQTTANNAQTTANNAQTTATNAQTTATNAQTSANAAVHPQETENRVFYGMLFNGKTKEVKVSMGQTGGNSLDVTIASGNTPKCTITPPIYGSYISDINIETPSSLFRQPCITGLGGIVLRSRESTKQFKITVDDTGTLKVTEVTA